jgi:hypothetical protein
MALGKSGKAADESNGADRGTLAGALGDRSRRLATPYRSQRAPSCGLGAARK